PDATRAQLLRPGRADCSNHPTAQDAPTRATARDSFPLWIIRMGAMRAKLRPAVRIRPRLANRFRKTAKNERTFSLGAEENPIPPHGLSPLSDTDSCGRSAQVDRAESIPTLPPPTRASAMFRVLRPSTVAVYPYLAPARMAGRQEGA